MVLKKLFQILQVIFNGCVKFGHDPEQCKSSSIVMILKPDKPSAKPGSYWPISLLPILGKLLEKIMTHHLTSYMVCHNHFNPFQYGFHSQKSTVHQLLHLAEQISWWFEQHSPRRTVSIFINSEKAFDTVWHNGLRCQLIDAKFPEAVIHCISSYRRNQTGKISINNILSRAFPLLAGVPQGLALAPLLYIFFTHLMPTKIHHQILNSFYANDTCFALSNSKLTKLTVQDLLQPILTDLESY
jgi:hypothetical protein